MLKLRDEYLLPLLQFAQLIHVGRGAKPFDNPPRLVTYQRRTGLEPAIALPGSVLEAIICVELAALQRGLPCGQRPLAVIGMDLLKPAIVMAVRLRLTGIAGPLRGPGPARTRPPSRRPPADPGALGGGRARCL